MKKLRWGLMMILVALCMAMPVYASQVNDLENATVIETEQENESDVSIEYLGGSLRVDAPEDYKKTSIRFGYQISAMEGVKIVEWKWKFGTNKETLTRELVGTNKREVENGFVSNLVLTDVPVRNYNTMIYSQLQVTYTKDGETYTVIDEVRSRTILEVVGSILRDENASEEHIKYVNNLGQTYKKTVEGSWTDPY